MPPRHFPPSWSVDGLSDCFIVRDAYGHALGHFYFDDEPRHREVNRRLTKDEAQRMAVDFAKLHITRKEDWVVPPGADSLGMQAMREYLDAETERVRGKEAS